MPKNKIEIFYFSGTGNTLLITKAIKDVFEKHNINVILTKMEKTNPKEINKQHIIGLAFPVAMQGTFPLVWNFVRKLPNTKGTEIFMVDTLKEFSGGIVGPLKRLLKNKGYKTIGAKEILMPGNLLRRNINPEKDNKVIDKGIQKAKEYANAIIKKKAKWHRLPFLSDFLSLVSRSKRPWKLLRRLYPLVVDRKKCVKCGICARLCPVDNIEMADYPLHKDKCQYCMRCISFCNEKAISINNKNYSAYKAVPLKAMLKP